MQQASAHQALSKALIDLIGVPFQRAGWVAGKPHPVTPRWEKSADGLVFHPNVCRRCGERINPRPAETGLSRSNDQIPNNLESNRQPTAHEASRLNRRLGGPRVGRHRFSALVD